METLPGHTQLVGVLIMRAYARAGKLMSSLFEQEDNKDAFHLQSDKYTSLVLPKPMYILQTPKDLYL